MHVAIQEIPRDMGQIETFKPYADMVIVCERDAEYVTDRRAETKTKINEIETTRKRFTQPILEAKRRIDEQAKAIIAPLEAIVRVLDRKLLAWHESQETIRRKEAEAKRAAELERLEAQRKADLEAAMIDDEAIVNVERVEKSIEQINARPVEIDRKVRTQKGTTYVSTYWEFEVVDESLIPDEFWLLDTSALGKHARAHHDAKPVPGVRFVEKKRIGGSR